MVQCLKLEKQKNPQKQKREWTLATKCTHTLTVCVLFVYGALSLCPPPPSPLLWAFHTLSRPQHFTCKCTHIQGTRMHKCMQKEGRARLGEQQGSVQRLHMQTAAEIFFSHVNYVWAANMNSAPWTRVDLSPLKRCCHNAFIFSPCWVKRAGMPPNGENV